VLGAVFLLRIKRLIWPLAFVHEFGRFSRSSSRDSSRETGQRQLDSRDHRCIRLCTVLGTRRVDQVLSANKPLDVLVDGQNIAGAFGEGFTIIGKKATLAIQIQSGYFSQ